ncbi:MAG: aminotransferase class I/II-fold pyridoxal phosphate-dependent enzyme [Lachnospiraceae bacterium]|nr:aminotransferase class I/II-fold pyridoxal phosphate-dependent enzyme [Lachnospiraceae bacterium]
MGKLFDEISKVAEETQPLHMPGHKRNTEIFTGRESRLLQPFYQYDMTEIAGTDDLHHAEGILKEAQQRAADLYGAGETFFLVGGSTLGVLAGISAVVPFGGTLLMPRCSHKSVYHVCGLRHITPLYMEGEKHPLLGFDEGITPQDVEKVLLEGNKVDAVCITSPTYEGRILDVAGIAKVVHRYKLPLLVDSAHGAHLGVLSKESFPNATACGADVVIHSLHKTLPAPTQTALLHICSDKVDRQKVAYYLGVYETSSPSYPLLIGIDSCLSWVEQSGKKAWENFCEKRIELAKKLSSLQKIKVIDFFGGDGLDPCKMVLFDASGSHGMEIAAALRDAGLEPELTAPGYVLLILTPCDGEECYERLAKVVLTLDEKKWNQSQIKFSPYRLPERALSLFEGIEREMEMVPLMEAAGRISGAMVMLYPPGQPMIVPGEIFSKELLQQILGYEQAGLNITGLQNGLVQVVKE